MVVDVVAEYPKDSEDVHDVTELEVKKVEASVFTFDSREEWEVVWKKACSTDMPGSGHL